MGFAPRVDAMSCRSLWVYEEDGPNVRSIRPAEAMKGVRSLQPELQVQIPSDFPIVPFT